MCTGQRSGEFKGFQTHLAVGLDVHVRTGIQQLDDFGDITLLSSLLERGEAGEGVVIIDPHLSLLGVCVCGLWVESVGKSAGAGALARFRELDCVAPIGEERGIKKRISPFLRDPSRSDSAPSIPMATSQRMDRKIPRHVQKAAQTASYDWTRSPIRAIAERCAEPAGV
jgi:hypothetical protein